MAQPLSASTAAYVEDKPLTPTPIPPKEDELGRRPRILVVNDDGIKSSGLKQLAIALEDIGDVVVVSTIDNQIHPSFSITIQEQIRAKRMENWGNNIVVFAVSGFPMNCLKFAYGHVIPKIMQWNEIDVVIAGVNKGRNVGTDLLYSGTAAMALAAKFENESFMAHNKTPKAIAISLCPPSMRSSSSLSSAQYVDWNFDIAVKAALQITKLALQGEQTPNVVWNVNIPSTPKQRNGIYYWAVTKPASLKYDASNLISITKDDEKLNYHDFVIIGPDCSELAKYEAGTDLHALKRNIISISPIELSPALHTPLHATNNLIHLFMSQNKKMVHCDTRYFWNINVEIRPLLSIVQCLQYWLRLKQSNYDDTNDTVLLQTYTLYLERDIKICPEKQNIHAVLSQRFNWSSQQEKFNETLNWSMLQELYAFLSDVQRKQTTSPTTTQPLLPQNDTNNLMLKGALMLTSVAALVFGIAYYKKSSSPLPSADGR